MSEPRISVVVPNQNGSKTLRACIESLLDVTAHPNWELIVVDNGSTDGSLDYLRGRSGIRLAHEPRRGVAAALNAGFALAGRNDVVRVHADVVVETPEWLSLLAETARAAPKAGIVGAKLVYPDDRIHSVGRSIVTGVGWYDRHANLRCFQLDDGRSGDPVEVDAVPGALAYVRREVLDATGGADERYWPVWGEDDDLCMMARFRGYKVYAHPGVKAVHFSCVWSPTAKPWVADPRETAYKAPMLKQALIEAHAEAWLRKWGWQPRFPDLGEIRRLYGDTEICWQIGERLRFSPREWPPDVDVVMVTWNNRKTLARCLESLARTRYPKLSVHVADNASTDGTAEFLEELKVRFPFPLHVHRLPVNTGVAIGFNTAIVNGSAELVARLDDDVIVPPEWLAALVENFRRRPYAGVVGPKILNDNRNRDIQCGPYRLFPSLYGHDGEPDAGQADYLARAVHVRGCCNVYRRDVLERCGLFDLRFSPSQFDDPDHHVALGAAGYEILYDGRVAVVHALNNGASRSFAAISNTEANRHKLTGKWGEDIWMILDRAIDLSVEGRYLPEDGDTAEYLRRLPSPESYPRLEPEPVRDENREKILLALELREKGLSGDGPSGNLWDDHVGLAASMRRDGDDAQAAQVLHGALDLRPDRGDVLADLALTYARLGQPERARLLLDRARRLWPELSVDESQWSRQGTGTGAPADRSGEIGEARLVPRARRSHESLRVLVTNTFERRVAGGDMHQLRKTKQHLEEMGLTFDVRYTPRPDPRGYDLVHVFNLWFPHQTLPQVKSIRVAAPDVPIVMTPIYWDMTEKAWADTGVMSIFLTSKTQVELEARLANLANGSIRINGRRRLDRNEPNFSGFHEYQKQILALVDRLLPQSELEMKNLEETLGIRKPYTIVRNAAEADLFERATPEAFVERYGLKDFVVTVGLVEPRKNQLLLLYALRDTGLPVVVLGRNYDRNYLRLCREFAPPSTLFIEHLPHELLASALKAARVFALPSWMECASFAAIEAALAGCAMVVSNRTSEPEYFGDAAYYCDPASVSSIRGAVLRAYQNHGADAGKRERLRALFTQDYTWRRAAEHTLEGYRRAIAARGGAGSGLLDRLARALDGDPSVPIG